MANNKNKRPEELNWFEILQILNGIERHYLEMGWDYNKSSRYQELVKYCLDNKERLYDDWEKSKDLDKHWEELVPTELFWKIRDEEYGFNKRDNTIKEKGGDDARLLH